MIDQFINQAVSQLGISQQDAEQGTSGLLSLLQQNADGSNFSSLLSKIGGAETLMNQYDAGKNLDSGASGLLGAAAGLLGGQTGSNMALITSLISQLNIDSSQLAGLANMFFAFVKEQ
ncbi:MAG: DUF2780 domain-containing protein, partial [Rickettsiales bacterium]|nr:DUF2780 domain-containing protein [Rickettsiales bacterium]